MSTTSVVRLHEYRSRREQRLRRTLALYGADPERARIARHLWEVLELVGADRAATVWVDEYGPGLVHVHCLLDLASDDPRRSFSMEALRGAWEDGVPGLLDRPDLGSEDRILPGRPRSMATVALGSDGVRAWFLVVDSRTPRPPLTGELGDSFMFLAGECTSFLLHRDLEPPRSSVPDPSEDFEELRRERFSGWPVLRDAEDEPRDEEADRRITARFLVTRILRGLVDDDLTVDRDALRRQVEGTREELEKASLDDPEAHCWRRVLAALETWDEEELARATLQLGKRVELQGHFHGARELHRIAYDIAAALGDVELAADAARFLGMVSRRLVAWDDSVRWYESSLEICSHAGLRRTEALARDGLGNTHRERGNLPGAREALEEALEIGLELDDAEILGAVHQDLMIVEKHARHTDEAVRHGWAAVQAHPSQEKKLGALLGLGSVFLKSGDLASAEDAFHVVSRRAERLDARVLSLDALAHVAARRGDRDLFRERLRALDGVDPSRVSAGARAEIRLFRGRSYAALGDVEEARGWLRGAVAFAEENEISRVLFEAEAELDALEGAGEAEDGSSPGSTDELPTPTASAVSGVREGLTKMRGAPVSAPL